MPLTKKQRDWVRKRNGNRCVHCWYDEDKGGWVRCKEHRGLQVHHIRPQGWSDKHLENDPDRPHNLVTLCEQHHTGR